MFLPSPVLNLLKHVYVFDWGIPYIINKIDVVMETTSICLSISENLVLAEILRYTSKKDEFLKL